MSGAGRKHRAKQLTSDHLDESWDPVLGEGEELVKVLTSPGGKNVNVQFLATPDRIESVTIPGKFTKVIWLMRGDWLIVAHGTICRKITEKQLRAIWQSTPGAVHQSVMDSFRHETTTEVTTQAQTTDAGADDSESDSLPEYRNSNRRHVAAAESESSDSDNG